MTAVPANSTRTVADAEVARVLSDPEHLRFIAPFLGRERTLSEVAREVGSSLSTTYRRAVRYVDLGVLEVTREVRRHGRALKLYRTVADAFYIPSDLKRAADPSLSSLGGYFERAVRRGFEHAYGDRLHELGERIFRNADGTFSTMLAKSANENADLLEPTDVAALSTSSDALYLDHADAKRLQRDLHDLLNAYGTKRGAQRYLVRLALLPLPPDPESIL